VVVGVHLAGRPLGRIEARPFQRTKRGALDLLEDPQGPALRGPVDALPGLLQAPAHRLALQVCEVEPTLASEEALRRYCTPRSTWGLPVG
jgi:hypothetical protein